MDQGLLPRRYAKALYKFALGKDFSKRAYTLMENLVDAFEHHPSMAKIMANPFVSDKEKTGILLTASCASLPDDAPLADFFTLLEKKRRVDIAMSIALAYCAIYRRENNIYRVSIISAAPLADEDSVRIKNMIEKHLGDASAQYSFSVDPSIIGGFIVNIDSRLLDASVKNQLKQLKLNLLGN